MQQPPLNPKQNKPQNVDSLFKNPVHMLAACNLKKDPAKLTLKVFIVHCGGVLLVWGT